MMNFVFHNPVKILFGAGQIAAIAAEIPASARILLTYGGGSIMKNGVYAQVKKALEGRTVFEFGGIEPNPSYETLMGAVELARKEKIDFLLAVGGGSVLDGTKFVAAAVPFRGEPWDILSKGAKVESMLPVGAVLTLPATGSEMNGAAVISRLSTKDKLAFITPLAMPKFSVLDPLTTKSLPERQVANGVVDAFVHVCEQYLTVRSGAALQDRQAEAVLSTLVEYGPRALAERENEEVLATVMWSATNALNGLIGVGVPQDWASHGIGHELTAAYGLDHARTLAAVLPALLEHCAERKRPKLAQFAERVWGINSGTEAERASAAIAATRAFFERMGTPTRLSAYGIDAAEAAPMAARRLADHGRTAIGEGGSLSPADAEAIVRLAA